MKYIVWELALSEKYKKRKSSHYREFFLPEVDGHQVSVRLVGAYDQDALQAAQSLEDVGRLINQEKPVLLHWTGGPGLATPDGITRAINTRHFNLFLISYRGTVNSMPLGKTEHNTTQHIVDDGKRLLKTLGVRDFYMSGFCFGTVVATVMAAQMHDQCKGLGLFFPYTSSQLDDGWLFDSVRHYDDRAKSMWEKMSEFASFSGEQSAHISIINAFARAVENGDQKAMRSYGLYQGLITGCIAVPDGVDINNGLEKWNMTENQQIQTKMELHYAKNEYFLGRDGVIPYMKDLQDIPLHIVYSTKNKSFHPDSIQIWKDNCPHANIVDTGSEEHHMLDTHNHSFANAMFDFLEDVSLNREINFVPPPVSPPEMHL
jgi:proline iminopeptidase